jgi:hypothetical protein
MRRAILPARGVANRKTDMFIDIAPSGAVSLEDADNFRAFKVVAAGQATDPSTLAARLGSAAARVEDGHAWISEDWLRAAGRPHDEAWLEGLNGMIAFARRSGWVDDQARAIQAHVEWTG